MHQVLRRGYTWDHLFFLQFNLAAIPRWMEKHQIRHGKAGYFGQLQVISGRFGLMTDATTAIILSTLRLLIQQWEYPFQSLHPQCHSFFHSVRQNPEQLGPLELFNQGLEVRDQYGQTVVLHQFVLHDRLGVFRPLIADVHSLPQTYWNYYYYIPSNSDSFHFPAWFWNSSKSNLDPSNMKSGFPGDFLVLYSCFSMGFPSHILGSPAPRPARPGQDRGETLTTFFLRCVDWPINGKCHQREKWEPSHGWTLEWLRKN